MTTPKLPPEEWIRISGDETHGGLGVAPNITSEADYWKALSVGQDRASALAESLCAVDPVLTAGEIKLINHEYMRDVFPAWADKFRAPGLAADPGEDGNVGFELPSSHPLNRRLFVAVEWEGVPEAMREITARLADGLENASPEEKWKALGAYSVDLVNTQPFLDGNKRLARVIFEAQVKAVLGFEGEVHWPEKYNAMVGNAAADRVFEFSTEEVAERSTRADRTTFRRALEAENPELHARISALQDDYRQAQTDDPRNIPPEPSRPAPTTTPDPKPQANPAPEADLEKVIKDFKAPPGDLGVQNDPEKRQEVEKASKAATRMIMDCEKERDLEKLKLAPSRKTEKDPEPSM